MNMYDKSVEQECTVEFDDEFQKRLISIIERAMQGKLDSNAEAAILFHWLRHQDDPAYAFVPEKYKSMK